MKPAELFALLLKVMGVGEVVKGLESSPLLFGHFVQVGWNNEVEFVAALIGTALTGTVIHILAGCALFFGADWLTNKVYKKRGLPNDSELAGA